MAKFAVDVGGTSYEVEAPDERTAWQWANATHEKSKPAPLKQIDVNGPQGPTGSFLENVGAGAGKAIYDTGRGLGQLARMALPDRAANAMGLPTQAEIDEAARLDKPLMETGGGLVGNIGTNIGIALAPGAALSRGSGAVAKVGQMMNAAPPTLGGALVGAGMGAGLAGIQPVASNESRATNMAFGGILGAAPSALGAGYRSVKSAVEPFYEKGQQQILARALRTAAGGQGDDAMRALSEAGTPFVGPSQPGMQREIMGELIAGSTPTAGQASGNAGIAALERAAVATDPAVTQQYAQRLAAQNAARVGAVEDLAGRGGALDFAIANRAGTADQLYKQAVELGIDPALMTAGRKGEITKLLKRPAIQQAMKEARTLAANEGVNMSSPAGSVKGLDYVKRALDDQIGKAQGNEQRVLVELKNRLLTTIDTLSPEYAAARETFQQMSRPVNQMEIAEAIAQKSINPLTGQMQPQALARALTDQTAKTATGFRGATLENVMEPQQMGRLNAVRDDLARAVAAQNAGRGAGSDTVQKLAYANILNQSGVPSFLRNFAPAQVVGNLAGRGADVAYARANRELSQKLAETLLDPQATAELLKTVTPSQRRQLIAEILASTAKATAIGGATTALNFNQ